MGSPALDLRLPERLRPWRGAGVTHLYAPDVALLHANHDDQRVESPQGARPGQRRHDALPKPAGPDTSSQAATNYSTAPGQVRFAPPWDQFWEKASAPSPVVFTYSELSDDLLGRGDKRRSMLFRELLSHLRWTGKGYVSFWPCELERGGAREPALEEFWAGVRAIEARYVVVFGSAALEMIAPGAQGAGGTVDDPRAQLVILPDVQELLVLLPHERQMRMDSLNSLRLKG